MAAVLDRGFKPDNYCILSVCQPLQPQTCVQKHFTDEAPPLLSTFQAALITFFFFTIASTKFSFKSP